MRTDFGANFDAKCCFHLAEEGSEILLLFIEPMEVQMIRN